ncbi:MAG: carboxypeptidase regulatory-like domain-containing protein [Anaerolineales bacterium]|nr:carboxypeptidase regulatory-like domain-containing protein [Anaerolineales bacterium]
MVAEGRPVAGATVVVAERTARPHVVLTGADGRYRIEGLPPDEYVPAAVAPGYAETALAGGLGVPALVAVKSGVTSHAPDLTLLSYAVESLPTELANAVHLRQTAAYTASATFPEDAVAQVRAYAFDYNGVTVDSLRLYLPITATPGVTLPLALLVAPTAIDDWQQVSVAFAAMGHALVGISPMPARGVDAEAQAQDVRVALSLAQQGALGPEVGANKPVAMGGSYSSAILARLVRAAGSQLAGWVTVGGLSNAFEGAER